MRFFLCAIALQRAASMVPPAACVARMDAFCNSDPKMAGCLTQIKAQGALLPLVALSDGSAAGTQPQWRCYSPTCLDASRTHYIRGGGAKGCAEYCTEDAALGALLSDCATTSLFVNGANSTHCFRIPNVVQAGYAAPGPTATSGSSAAAAAPAPVLLAFAEARRDSCSDRGPKSLASRRSLDGGATWEPTRFLVTDAAGATDGLNLGASVYDAATGTVFVHYGVCGHNCRPAGTTFVLSSADQGASWHSSNITAAVTAAGWGMINAGPGTGVQLPPGSGSSSGSSSSAGPGGRLAVAFWGRRLSAPDEPEGGVGALLSDDGGASWQLSAGPVLASAAHAPNECQLARLGNGSLLMNVRDARVNGCKCRLFTRSDDAGQTWSRFQEQPALTGPICQGSMISVDDGGNSSSSSSSSSSGSSTPLFYSAPQSLEGREDGYIKASVDNGASWWLRGARLDSAADPGFGYSGLVDLGSAGAPHVRQLGVVYEPGNGQAGVNFKIVSVDTSDILG